MPRNRGGGCTPAITYQPLPAIGRDYVLEYARNVATGGGQWKCIPGEGAGGKQKAKHGPAGGGALCGLAKDPGESSNVAAQHRDVVRRLSQHLESLRSQERTRP